MDIEMREQNENKMTFVLDDATPAFANALRRTLIGKVPTLAIEDVRITENSSALFDEVLAHRLGMIAWAFDPDAYTRREECDCEDGCSRCTVTFVLQKEGPGSVYAEHLKPTDKSIEAVNPETLLVKLLEDQEVDVEADAIMGRGEDHAKWQAAIASYQYYPEITIKDGVDADEAIKACREGFKVENNELVVDDVSALLACHRSTDLSDFIEVEERDDRFIFTVESVSGIPPADAVRMAVQTLKNDLDAFAEQL